MVNVEEIDKGLWKAMSYEQKQLCATLNPSLSEEFLMDVWGDLRMDTQRKIISRLSDEFLIWQCEDYDPESLNRTESVLSRRNLSIENNEVLWVEMGYRRRVILINQNVPLSFIEERWNDMDAVEQGVCLRHCWDIITAEFLVRRWTDMTPKMKSNLQPGIIKKAPRELLPIFLADDHYRIRNMAQEALAEQED